MFLQQTQPTSVTCHVLYRSNSEAMFEPREGVLLTVNKPKRADPPGSTRPGETREAAFKDLRFEVNYVAAGFQGVERAELRVRVFDVRTRKPLLYQHYVFNEKQPPRNQFAHGFTGLVYVFHPESKAELWFSCSVGGQ